MTDRLLKAVILFQLVFLAWLIVPATSLRVRDTGYFLLSEENREQVAAFKCNKAYCVGYWSDRWKYPCTYALAFDPADVRLDVQTPTGVTTIFEW